MDDALTPATPDAVRASIARCALGDPDGGSHARPDARLGAVTLHPHQIDAVVRVRAIVHREGGALLADAVGLGKTYVALAMARDAVRPLVVAPAALRDMWRAAMAAANVHASIVSFEALSRRASRSPPARRIVGRDRPDLVVVDEAHHARNPRTRRYAALAELCVGAPTLLLSATPVHNRRADVAAILALFLGDRAYALDDSALARFVVRRDGSALDPERHASQTRRIPVVGPPVVLALPADDSLPELILALPPPLPPRDGDDGGVLVAHSLVRQWASSDAALRAALRRRLAGARAIASSLDGGVYPSHAELRAWTSDGESQQLAFAELLAPPRDPPRDLAAMRRSVAAHAAALRALLAAIDRDDARDDARATLLLDLCRRHPGQRVVAFAAYAETVRALFRRLHRDVPAAALTAAGAVVAGGRLSRREALARFAPLACAAPPPRRAERIELLLATDILSEGVSLVDAAVAVHLDLPWTPARLEQRVGRVARLGSPHGRVAVYAVAPPASAEVVLSIERRLGEKLRATRSVVGVAGAILPPGAALLTDAGARSPSEAAEEVRRILERWRRLDGGRAERVVALLRCRASGFLAACRDRAAPGADLAGSVPSSTFLLASLGGSDVTDEPRAVHAAVVVALAGEAGAPTPADAEPALAAIGRWAARRAAIADAGIADSVSIRVRRRVIRRIAAIARRMPAHRRVDLATLAASARRAALARCGAGGERVLEELARADLPDEAWLRAVRAFGESTAAGREVERAAPAGVEVLALLLLRS